MWVRQSMWDRSIELGLSDRWVITTRPHWAIEHWFESGLTRVPQERVGASIRAALAEVRAHHVPALWECLYEYLPSPPPRSLHEFARELTRAAREPLPGIIVLERLIERGRRSEPLIWKPFPLPPRSASDHYVVIEAVDTAGVPVPGVQVELLIADGEIKRAQTDAAGIARVERVQAGRVVIRVLGIDGARWRPLEGEASQPSGARQGAGWHLVQQGECLSRIAERHGLRGWQALWEHPKNEALRKRRKSPHVLLPGDEVALPGVTVHEIVRGTDATHRIEVDARTESNFRMRLVDPARQPFAALRYELSYEADGRAVKRAGRAATDSEGWLEETVPMRAERVVVHLLKPALSFQVALGHLDPVRDEGGRRAHVRGVAQRLSALGYAAAPGGEVLDARTALALRAFQADELRREQADADLDDETLSALMSAYGA